MAVFVQWRRIGLVVIGVCLYLTIISCSLLAQPQGVPQPQQPFQQPPAQPAQPQGVPQPQQPFQQPPAQPAQPQGVPQPQQPFQQPPAAEINLVGIWEGQIMTDYGVMYTEMILQPNGNYSYQAVLGDLMTWEVGAYEIVADQNFIHFTLENYGPTTYKGTQLSRPMSWSVFYTVVDADTMIWEDRVLGTQWTVYRKR